MRQSRLLKLNVPNRESIEGLGGCSMYWQDSIALLFVGFPSSLLAMRPLQWLLKPLLDDTRPMDSMALSFQLPAEDEIATCSVSGLRSCSLIPSDHSWQLQWLR